MLGWKGRTDDGHGFVHDYPINCMRNENMELNYKKATLEDIDLLTAARVQVLKEANKLADGTDHG